MATVLVIDDDEHLRKFLARGLKRKGYGCVTAENGEAAIAKMGTESYDAVVCDLHMPGVDGLDVLRYAHRELPTPPPFIVITAYGSVTHAVQAMKEGASDFVEKPVGVDELAASVQGAINRHAPPDKRKPRFGSRVQTLVGSNRWLDPFLQLLRRIAQTDTVVLIDGETGTGKSAVARQIYLNSKRSEGPFVELNCAAIPDQLMESELFGHTKGAFTGADDDYVGRVPQADGGTLFLDEIGELKLELQSKLLHLLAERSYTPVGGQGTHSADVRFVAATNRDLDAEVKAGRFRMDLYYRLNVVNLTIPPLRERVDDIPALLEHFRELVTDRVGHGGPAFSDEAMGYLKRYEWPGNIRELENVVEQMAIMRGPDVVVEPQDLPERIRRQPRIETQQDAVPKVRARRTAAPRNDSVASDVDLSRQVDFREVVQSFERDIILNVLRRVNGNKTKAAKMLQLKRTTLIEKCKKLDINDETIDSGSFQRVRPVELELNGSVRAWATPPAFGEFEAALKGVGRAHSPVLIRGPSESGRMVAERIHALSERAAMPIHHCEDRSGADPLMELLSGQPSATHAGTWALYNVDRWDKEGQEQLVGLIDQISFGRLSETTAAHELPRLVVVAAQPEEEDTTAPELIRRLSFFHLRVNAPPESQ